MSTYVDDTRTESQKYFKLQIPASFDYDTNSSFATDLAAELYSIDYQVDLDPEHAAKGIVNGKKTDLRKYAAALKKIDFTMADTAELSGIKIDPVIQSVNGFSMLRLQYHLKETFNGKESEKYCYLYLIPVYHGSAQVVYVRFCALPGKPDVFPGHNPKAIMKTIQRY
jgi:hypothetical protein